MQTMRSTWTDDRMDDLNHKVDETNREMHAEFRAFRSEMKSEFQAMRGEMNGRFDSVQAQMAAIQKSMNLTMVTMLGGFFTLLAATFATLI